MNHIFISYRWSDSKSDDDFREVVNVIEQTTGLTAFWDTRELRSGNFINNLQDGVRSADIFMPVVTQSYLQFGKEGGRDDDKDFCLLEVAAAASAGKKIVPIFCGVDGNIKTVSDDEARASAQRVLDLSYTEKEITILQKHLCSQNGVTINEVDAEQISKHTERLCSIVFDTFCSAESDITFFKKYLDALAERLDPIRIFGDFDESNGRAVTVVRSVPSGLVEEVAFIDNHIRRSEHRVTEVFNYSDNHIFIDYKIQSLTDFDIMLPRKALADNDIPWHFDTFRAAFDELEIRKHREEILADSSHFGFNKFHFGHSVGDLICEGIGQAKIIWHTKAVDVLSVRAFARDAVLLPRVTADDDDKGEADGKADGLDDGVKFVS